MKQVCAWLGLALFALPAHGQAPGGLHLIYLHGRIIQDQQNARPRIPGVVTTRCPASLLWLHPDVTVYCDRDAAGKSLVLTRQVPDRW